MPVPVSEGIGAAETARRLAALRVVLAEVVHATAGRIAREPSFEAKTALAAHLYDDARSLVKLDRRLAELPATAPAAPAGELAAVLERLPDDPELAYAAVKPALAAAARDQLRALEPAVDDATLRLLTQLVHRQERHRAELPARGEPVELELAPGAPPAPQVAPRPEQPARDPFIQIGEPGDGGLHDLVHAKLCGAELAGRAIHETPGAPAGQHADLARVASDLARHAIVCDRAMGGAWGTHPVAPGYPAAGALPAEPATVFDHLRADERVHAQLVRS